MIAGLGFMPLQARNEMLRGVAATDPNTPTLIPTPEGALVAPQGSIPGLPADASGGTVPQNDITALTQRVGAQAQAAPGRALMLTGTAMLSAGVYGGIIGNLSTMSVAPKKKWQGAGTGALAAAGMAGTLWGATYLYGKAWTPGLVSLGLGGGALVWGLYRAFKK